MSLLGCSATGNTPRPPVVEVEQHLQPSGGVSGGPLGDSLSVFAIDASTNQPLAGAHVVLGAGDSGREVGVTGSDGKVEVSGLGASPDAQTVSVTMSGYTSASWAGVSTAAVTLPLAARSLPDLTATVDASIAGYDSLPALAPGHYRMAAFVPSLPVRLDTLEFENALIGSCPASTAPGKCEATLSGVPVTSNALLAVVVEGDDAGTPADSSDDTLTMTGLGVATGLALDQHTTVEVSLLASDLVAHATIDLGPNGASQDVIGVPGVTLGNQVILYPTFSGNLSSFLVPTTSGAMSNATLWAVATSRPAVTGSAIAVGATSAGTTSWSRVYARGIATPASGGQSITIQTGGFLSTPSLDASGGSYSLASSGALARLEFSSGGTEQMDVLMLPGQTTFSPPSSLDMIADRVDALSFDVTGLNPQSFSFSEIVERSSRIAYTDVALSATP